MRHEHLAGWERELEEGVGDADASAVLVGLMHAAKEGALCNKRDAMPADTAKTREVYFGDMMWELREQVCEAAAVGSLLGPNSDACH